MDENLGRPTSTVASENLEFVAKIEMNVGNAGRAEQFRTIAASCRTLELEEFELQDMRHARELMPWWSFVRRSKIDQKIIDRQFEVAKGWLLVAKQLDYMKKQY